jgi:hypothetical protein
MKRLTKVCSRTTGHDLNASRRSNVVIISIDPALIARIRYLRLSNSSADRPLQNQLSPQQKPNPNAQNVLTWSDETFFEHAGTSPLEATMLGVTSR